MLLSSYHTICVFCPTSFRLLYKGVGQIMRWNFEIMMCSVFIECVVRLQSWQTMKRYWIIYKCVWSKGVLPFWRNFTASRSSCNKAGHANYRGSQLCQVFVIIPLIMSQFYFSWIFLCVTQGFELNSPAHYSGPKRKTAFSQPQIYSNLLFNCFILGSGYVKGSLAIAKLKPFSL